MEVSVDRGRVWIAHPELGYAPGFISGTDPQGNYIVSIEGKEEVIVKKEAAAPVHPSCLCGVPDLLSLGEFDLGPLLHNIRIRYFKDEIYTGIGSPILISVNPYRLIPNLYTASVAALYRVEGPFGCRQLDVLPKRAPGGKVQRQDVTSSRDDDALEDGPPPHLFKIAQAAHSRLFSDLANQSIIITGESGAGKTEATKIILNYLASAEIKESSTEGLGSLMGQDGVPCIEKQVLQANPVLESFGNAKTLRNDNSSRFGKFTQIYFDMRTTRLMGAQISNYLLEKSRIVVQQPDERNYHVFYQLCAGRHTLDQPLQDRLKLTEASNFSYLSQCVDIAGREEAEDLKELLDCLQGLGFSAESRDAMLGVLAGILHLGNVSFKDEEVVTVSGTETVCELLGLEKPKLEKLLLTHSIPDNSSLNRVKDGVITMDRRFADILSTRDAISKTVYERLFLWLVRRINETLSSFSATSSVKGGSKEMLLNSIGLLDIYGFEVFDVNSFEQLCINYANEQLQQHFNRQMFSQEQRLYQSEGIDWSVIEFQDNQNIIDALHHPHTGVLQQLNSECIAPGGSDLSFLQKMLAHPSQPIVFRPSLVTSPMFGVAHYAGPVSYDVTGMLDKNRNRVHPDVFACFRSSSLPFLQELFSERAFLFAPPETGPSKVGSAVRAGGTAAILRSGQPASFRGDTVAAKFKEQLAGLMKVLNETNALYIRCIKPNSNKAVRSFDGADVLRQLKCAGMLESVRIRRAGYSIRYSFNRFLINYRVLLRNEDFSANELPDVHRLSNLADMKAACTRLLRRICQELLVVPAKEVKTTKPKTWGEAKGGQPIKSISPTKLPPIIRASSELWQVGHNKVFMKEEMQTFLEREAQKAKAAFATLINRTVRGFLARARYLKMREAAEVIKCFFHVAVARIKLKLHQRSSAAITVQSYWRMLRLRRGYVRTRISVNTIRSFWLLFQERQRLSQLQRKSHLAAPPTMNATLSIPSPSTHTPSANPHNLKHTGVPSPQNHSRSPRRVECNSERSIGLESEGEMEASLTRHRNDSRPRERRNYWESSSDEDNRVSIGGSAETSERGRLEAVDSGLFNEHFKRAPPKSQVKYLIKQTKKNAEVIYKLRERAAKVEPLEKRVKELLATLELEKRQYEADMATMQLRCRNLIEELDQTERHALELDEQVTTLTKEQKKFKREREKNYDDLLSYDFKIKDRERQIEDLEHKLLQATSSYAQAPTRGFGDENSRLRIKNETLLARVKDEERWHRIEDPASGGEACPPHVNGISGTLHSYPTKGPISQQRSARNIPGFSYAHSSKSSTTTGATVTILTSADEGTNIATENLFLC